jgi:hypothetical protein
VLVVPVALTGAVELVAGVTTTRPPAFVTRAPRIDREVAAVVAGVEEAVPAVVATGAALAAVGETVTALATPGETFAALTAVGETVGASPETLGAGFTEETAVGATLVPAKPPTAAGVAAARGEGTSPGVTLVAATPGVPATLTPLVTPLPLTVVPPNAFPVAIPPTTAPIAGVPGELIEELMVCCGFVIIAGF